MIDSHPITVVKGAENKLVEAMITGQGKHFQLYISHLQCGFFFKRMPLIAFLENKSSGKLYTSYINKILFYVSLYLVYVNLPSP